MKFSVYILMLILAAGPTPLCRAQDIPPDRLNTVVEALLRLGPDAVSANPKLQEALQKVLTATKGTERFVELVGTFRLTDKTSDLIKLAAAKPNDTAGVAAANLLLSGNGTAAIREALTAGDETNAAGLVRALGNTGRGNIVPVLASLLVSDAIVPVVKKETLRALANSRSGAQSVIDLAKSGNLPDSLRLTASMELNGVRWEDIRGAAAELLPLPQAQGGRSLAPVSELLRRRGNPAAGRKVFANELIACNRCHVIGGEGADFGPALSEIGSKLTKEALYESILNPSGGISMGFEAWTIETRDNDEFFGIIVSDTDKEIVLKQVGGLAMKIAKENIAHRRKSGLSSMPAGLQQLMTEQALVDLVEYLASLKKAP